MVVVVEIHCWIEMDLEPVLMEGPNYLLQKMHVQVPRQQVEARRGGRGGGINVYTRNWRGDEGGRTVVPLLQERCMLLPWRQLGLRLWTQNCYKRQSCKQR